MSDELPAEEYHAEETEYTEQEETYEESPHDVEQQDGTAELQGEVTQNEGDGEYDENELGEDKTTEEEGERELSPEEQLQLEIEFSRAKKEKRRLEIERKRKEYTRPKEYPRLLQQEDFLFSSVYLPPGGLHTREDGSMGFHIEMEQFDGNLGFVPIRSKIIPHYVQLRKALDKVENQMMQTGEDISNTKKKLEDPELDEDLRDEIEAEIKELQRKKRLEYASWKNLSKELDEDEERGQCVYYSLVDTEGRKIETEDVYRHNVQPEKHVIKEEEEELNKVIEETEKEWVDTPSSTFRIYTDATRADAKLIAELEIKRTAIDIQRKARGKLYDLAMY